MRSITWNEFNLCVEKLTSLCRKKNFCGVYGFPRGGLCLAVALSHSLNIPFLDDPKAGSLVVDDVYETGKTLSQVASIKNITTFVWFSKVEPQWWEAIQVVDPKEWLIFPWENHKLAEKDKRIYEYSRF